MRDRSHEDAMVEFYEKDPTYALDLLNSILEDGDQGELLVALRRMTKAFGGVQSVAEKANLNPTQLYRTFRKRVIRSWQALPPSSKRWVFASG